MMPESTQSGVPDKIKLISQIKTNIPSDLLTSPIWLAYYYKKNPNGTYSKPPCSDKGHTVKGDTPGVTFEQACKDGYPGIKIAESSPLVAFDIDDKDAKLGKRKFDLRNLSAEFQEFLITYDSYTEISPSKCGLRILAVCPDKVNLGSSGRLTLNSNLCIGGEIFLSSGFVTITGDQIAGTEIAEMRADAILPWCTKKSTVKKDNVVEMPTDQMRLPSLDMIMRALDSCKLTQTNKVKKAYETVIGSEYNHYDFWIKIMASCHHYTTLSSNENDMLAKVLEWCKTDEDSYVSEEDVITHWSSFSTSKSGITYHTLLKFAQLLKFQWPVPMLDKNKNITGNPIPTVYKNLAYLMEYFEIKFIEDEFSHFVYVTTEDNEIFKQYFCNKISLGMGGPYNDDDLSRICFILAQDNGYTATPFGTLFPLIRAYIKQNIKIINILKWWLDTEPKELPEDLVEHKTDLKCSNLDYLISCIQFQESQDLELAKTFLDTFFFEMMMPLYNTDRQFAQRSFMLVMIGPENCRKTTFFSMLFPSKLRRIFVTNSTETLSGSKSIRDFAASLVTSALVVTDEFEIFYNKKNDSLFKTYVTADTVDYTPIYEKATRKAFKNAVLAGTTNRRSLAFEQDSNRRLAMLDITWIDTAKMQNINWHYFYRDYVQRGKDAMSKNIFPWKVSAETIRKQYGSNEQFRAKTNLELILLETFDFTFLTHKQAYNYNKIKSVQSDPNLYKMSDIKGILRQVYPDTVFSIAEMKHTLKRLCANYTNTKGKRIQLLRCEGVIEDGILIQTQHIRYLMPPRLTDF